MPGTMNAVILEPATPTEVDARQVMAWRNDPDALAASFHGDPKRWPDFFAEFKSTYFSLRDLPPLFACAGGTRIGYVRFRECADPLRQGRRGVDISINIAPENRGRGWGIRTIEAASRFALMRGVGAIIAEIKRGHAASESAFRKAGYSFLDERVKIVSDTGAEVPIRRYVLERGA